MGSTSTPRIPNPWLKYIASAAPRYATGALHSDDLRQIGCVAYIRARARHLPSRGPFEPYAKTAIKNAMLDARRAEQRQYDLPANAAAVSLDDEGTPWSAETCRVDDLGTATAGEIVRRWTKTLSGKDQIVIEGVFYDEVSQRELAARLGVSQPAVSQRKSAVLARAVVELAEAKKYLN